MLGRHSLLRPRMTRPWSIRTSTLAPEVMTARILAGAIVLVLAACCVYFFRPDATTASTRIEFDSPVSPTTHAPEGSEWESAGAARTQIEDRDEVPLASNKEEEIREYLESIPRGDEILAILGEDGVPLESLTIPPPFEQIRDAAREAFLMSEESEAGHRRQLMRWPDEGPDTDWLRNHYNLARDAELTALQMEEFKATAEAHNVGVRATVDEFLILTDQAYQRGIDRDEWEYYPFHTPPGLPAWEGEPRFASKGLAFGGWCIRMSLKKADHPDLADLTYKIQEAVWARDDELEAMIQAFEKELGH